MSTDPKAQWSYVKKRKKAAGSPPGPAPSGIPEAELRRRRSLRYRQRLAERGMVSIHILLPSTVAQRLASLAADRKLTVGMLVAELIRTRLKE